MWTVCALFGALVVIGLVLARFGSMVVTTSWTITESGEGGGVTSSGSTTKTGESVLSYTFTIAAAGTNVQQNIAFNTANLLALIITTTQDVTLKINSSGSPTDTITLKASTPWVWTKDSGITCPISGTAGAVTAGYFTNAGGTDATVKIRGLQDV